MEQGGSTVTLLHVSRSPSQRPLRSPSRRSIRSSHSQRSLGSPPSPSFSLMDSDLWFTDSPLASTNNDDNLPFGYVDLTAEPSSPAPLATSMAYRQTSPEVLEPQLFSEPLLHNAKRRRLNNGDPKNVITAGSSSPVRKIEEVDLSGVNNDRDLTKLLERQRADAIRAQQEQNNKPIRLSTLQCVVCMENMTNITATHCGHLFCHTCLMEALIAGENQSHDSGKGFSKCPICRKKVARSKPGKDGRQVIPLELKLSTRSAKAKEKQLSAGQVDNVQVL